jgi:hypothetical protein
MITNDLLLRLLLAAIRCSECAKLHSLSLAAAALTVVPHTHFVLCLRVRQSE